jgi:hypothetical protein
VVVHDYLRLRPVTRQRMVREESRIDPVLSHLYVTVDRVRHGKSLSRHQPLVPFHIQPWSMYRYPQKMGGRRWRVVESTTFVVCIMLCSAQVRCCRLEAKQSPSHASACVQPSGSLSTTVFTSPCSCTRHLPESHKSEPPCRRHPITRTTT